MERLQMHYLLSAHAVPPLGRLGLVELSRIQSKRNSATLVIVHCPIPHSPVLPIFFMACVRLSACFLLFGPLKSTLYSCTRSPHHDVPSVDLPVVLSYSAVVDGPGEYELVGFVSHMGSNTACGHYVAHIRVDGRFRHLLLKLRKQQGWQGLPLSTEHLRTYMKHVTRCWTTEGQALLVPAKDGGFFVLYFDCSWQRSCHGGIAPSVQMPPYYCFRSHSANAHPARLSPWKALRLRLTSQANVLGSFAALVVHVRQWGSSPSATVGRN
eukprot:scaffold214591_cov21-Tisochrysis_lutea.AAC.1